MPLLSKLFRGDPIFEACLVKDSAHITPGAKGFHIGKLHYALIILDRFNPPRFELEACVYGPATTAAVLDYKRKRRIINFAYQTQADNIVGKMTIARLDTEMLLFENEHRSVDFGRD